MTTPGEEPEPAGQEVQTGAVEAARPDREVFAVSPSAGWLPRIYVPQSSAVTGPAAALWRVTVNAARWAARQVSRRRPRNDASSHPAGASTQPKELP